MRAGRSVVIAGALSLSDLMTLHTLRSCCACVARQTETPPPRLSTWAAA